MQDQRKEQDGGGVQLAVCLECKLQYGKNESGLTTGRDHIDAIAQGP